MFLLYYNHQHPTVASSTSWDELLQEAVSEILNLDTQGLAEVFFE